MIYQIHCKSVEQIKAIFTFASSQGVSIDLQSGHSIEQLAEKYFHHYPCLVLHSNSIGGNGSEVRQYQTVNMEFVFNEWLKSKNIFKLSSEYSAVVEGGVTKVGRQTIPFELLEKIYLAAKASKQ